MIIVRTIVEREINDRFNRYCMCIF